MYFRPGNLVKDFVVEPVKRTVTTKGRAQTTYDTETRRRIITSSAWTTSPPWGSPQFTTWRKGWI